MVEGSGHPSVQTIPLFGTVLSRVDPPGAGWSGKGWARAWSLTLRLKISDETIEVRGFGPFRRALVLFGGPRSLQPQETVMRTTSISDSDPWRIPGVRKREWLALSCPLGSDAEYTLAVRPADGNFDRLRAVLRSAGVQER
jgi:hypothetical protein